MHLLAGFTTLWIYTILKHEQEGISLLCVLLPYGFTLFSNCDLLGQCIADVLLPYGFTLFSNFICGNIKGIKFYYLMDLHYSQTERQPSWYTFRFTTLWIYTILKRYLKPLNVEPVLLPYGFTLFSNYSKHLQYFTVVLLPYGFTLFSNARNTLCTSLQVLLPYGFTLFSNTNRKEYPYYVFYYLMDLHYSQTVTCSDSASPMFYYLMDLHYSQTNSCKHRISCSFTTLWIYTILKQLCLWSKGLNVLLPYGFTLFSNNKLLPVI